MWGKRTGLSTWECQVKGETSVLVCVRGLQDLVLIVTCSCCSVNAGPKQEIHLILGEAQGMKWDGSRRERGI